MTKEELNSVAEGTQPADNTQNGEETVEELKARLEKEEKARQDFEKAFKKEKEKRKELEGKLSDDGGVKPTEPEVNPETYVTKEDLFFNGKQIANDEVKNLIKSFATSMNISLEDAYNHSVIQAELKARAEKEQAAAISAGMQNNSAGGVDETFLSDEQFVEAYKNNKIEKTEANIVKFAEITGKGMGLY